MKSTAKEEQICDPSHPRKSVSHSLLNESRRVENSTRLLSKPRRGLLALLLFFDRDDFAALVVAAVGTNGVRLAHLATVRASDQVHRHQAVVRATAIAATA